MGNMIKFIILILGVASVVTVLYLLVKKRINERNSMLWLGGALIILMLALAPEILEIMAHATGVEYPPTLLFLFSTLVILLILLYQSIQISILQDKTRELAQHLAIINYSVNESSLEEQSSNRDEVMLHGRHVV